MACDCNSTWQHVAGGGDGARLRAKLQSLHEPHHIRSLGAGAQSRGRAGSVRANGAPRQRSPRQRSPRLGTEVWWHWGDPGERNSWRREGQTLQENDLYSLYMSMTLQFLWQNVHACVSLVGTNHAFHLSASAWCLGPAGFGSVSHSSCSLSPICSAFVGAFRRFWFCLPPVEQQKTLSVERL